MFRSSIFLACLLSFIGAAGERAFGQPYPAYARFSLRHNPNGVWSYLAAGTLLTTGLRKCAGDSNFHCWWNKGQVPNSAIIGAAPKRAATSFETIVLPPNYLALDPEGVGNVTLQWTAPSAGQVLAMGNFLGVDRYEASHTVAVLHNGTILMQFTIARYRQKAKFQMSINVAAGDTIGFASYSPKGYAYLTTGLQAKVTPQ